MYEEAWDNQATIEAERQAYTVLSIGQTDSQSWLPEPQPSELDLWLDLMESSKPSELEFQFTEGLEPPPPSDDADEVDDVDVVGRRIMTDSEIADTIADANDANRPLPVTSGSGSATPPATPWLPPLEDESCEDLAFLEQEREGKIARGRAGAIGLLEATGNFFHGDEIYEEIYDAFVQLDQMGGYQDGAGLSNAWAVYRSEGNPLDMLSRSGVGISILAAAQLTIFSGIGAVYQAKKELDLINAEQARRGGRCGG